MALLDIAGASPHEDRDNIIRILNYQQSDEGDYVVYTIRVRLGDREWTVRRRYSEFAAMDKARFAAYKQKSFLPPKRVLKSPAFLEQRRAELETYLRTLLELELWLAKKRGFSALPQPLSSFLRFPDCEVHAIVELLAQQMATKGEGWLAATHGHASKAGHKAFFQMSTPELHAVSVRLDLAEPTFTASGPKSDLGNVLDFLHRLPHLKVKMMTNLKITDCNPSMICGLASPRRTVRFLAVLYTLTKLADILVDSDDEPLVESRFEPEESSSSSTASIRSESISEQYASGSWPLVQDADFSFNQVAEIDESILRLPNCQTLKLCHNRLTDIGFHLQHLTALRVLNLSFNGLEKLELWHARLGNVAVLNLAGNSIRCLAGISKLYSLQELNLADNSIASTGEVWALSGLPCLSDLVLSGNPVESAVDYRSRVLEVFGERAGDVKLDGHGGSQKELDTVNVRLAIRKAKEEREKQVEQTRQHLGDKLRFLAEETLAGIPGRPFAYCPKVCPTNQWGPRQLATV